MEKLMKTLRDKNITVSAAESLTGGLFSESITSLSGASEVFKGSIVSYSNYAKINLLKVKSETIDEYGAVSSECCMEMCTNIRNLLDTDIGVSFTGNAGPLPSEGKKVGLVYVGISTKESTNVYENVFYGSREEVRIKCINFAVDKINELI